MKTNWAATAPATNTAEWDDLMESLGLTPSNRLPAPEPKPIRHGTPGGHKLHRKRGEPVCPACREARNTYLRSYCHRARTKETAA